MLLRLMIPALLGLACAAWSAAPAAADAAASLSAPAASADVDDALQPAQDEDGPLPEGVPMDESGDAAASPEAAAADLKALGSGVLARLSEALTADAEAVWYDSEAGEVGDEQAPGAWRVGAGDLYAELARRLSRDGDKDARAALNLAVLRGDARAQAAKDRAAADQKAEVLIAKIEGGDAAAQAKAKAALAALAADGNARARQYLGLDGPADAAATAPAAQDGLSPTASAAPEKAAETAPAPLSGTAEPARAGPGTTPAP